MAIKYANIFHRKTPAKFTHIGIFGLKICHLAILLASLKNVGRSASVLPNPRFCGEEATTYCDEKIGRIFVFVSTQKVSNSEGKKFLLQSLRMRPLFSVWAPTQPTKTDLSVTRNVAAQLTTS
jgi:hypothetical protein